MAVGALTRLVNTMAVGKTHKEVTPYFCRGNLFASVKKMGGHRPVAVGDILMRLTSKCIAVAGRAIDYLSPFLFDVGVQGGSIPPMPNLMMRPSPKTGNDCFRQTWSMGSIRWTEHTYLPR